MQAQSLRAEGLKGAAHIILIKNSSSKREYLN